MDAVTLIHAKLQLVEHCLVFVRHIFGVLLDILFSVIDQTKIFQLELDVFQDKPFMPLIVFANCSHISRSSLTNQLLINRNPRGNELALSILDNRDKGFSSLKEILSQLPVRNIRRRLARTA